MRPSFVGAATTAWLDGDCDPARVLEQDAFHVHGYVAPRCPDVGASIRLGSGTLAGEARPTPACLGRGAPTWHFFPCRPPPPPHRVSGCLKSAAAALAIWLPRLSEHPSSMSASR